MRTADGLMSDHLPAGFSRCLDRTSGEFLRETPFVYKLNWATGVDAKGRPIEVPGKLDVAHVSSRDRTFLRTHARAMRGYFSSARKAEPLKGFTGGGGEDIPSEPGQFFARAGRHFLAMTTVNWWRSTRGLAGASSTMRWGNYRPPRR